MKNLKSLIPILFGILILAVGYFGVYGYWGKLGDARAAYDASKLQNDKLLQAQRQSTAFLSKYQNNQEEVQKAQKVLPVSHSDIPTILDNFSKMVKESGLNLDELSVAQKADDATPPQPESIQSLDLQVKMTGSYEAFKNYLLRAERNLRLIDILSINAQSVSDDKSSNSLQFDLKIRTYYQQ